MRMGGKRHAMAALLLGKTENPLYRRLGGPQGQYGWVRNILPPLGFGPWTIQPAVSHYTNCATLVPTHIAQNSNKIEI
jgi:hypothetical protein